MMGSGECKPIAWRQEFRSAAKGIRNANFFQKGNYHRGWDNGWVSGGDIPGKRFFSGSRLIGPDPERGEGWAVQWGCRGGGR